MISWRRWLCTLLKPNFLLLISYPCRYISCKLPLLVSLSDPGCGYIFITARQAYEKLSREIFGIEKIKWIMYRCQIGLGCPHTTSTLWYFPISIFPIDLSSRHMFSSCLLVGLHFLSSYFFHMWSDNQFAFVM